MQQRQSQSAKNRSETVYAQDFVTARDENTIEASVTIQRAVEQVFRSYRDFKNLPSFPGDVMAIEQIGPATSRWTIHSGRWPKILQLPFIVAIAHHAHVGGG
jgi:uncharacterized membrane protein